MKKFSEEIGEEYDLFPLSVPHYDEIQDTTASMLKDYLSTHSDDSIEVVEGGCGTGITTRRLVETDPRVTVIAIDNEPVMLQQAQKALAYYGDRIRFVQGDILEEISKMSKVKALVFGFCIHNLPPDYRAKLFQAIGQAMAPGGIFINCDKIAQDDPKEHQKALKEQVDAFAVFTEHGEPELQEKWTKHYVQLDDPIRLTESEHTEALRQAGFRDIELVYRKRMDAIIIAIKQ